MYDYGFWHEPYWHIGAFFDIIFLLFVLFGIVYLVQQFSRLPPEENKNHDSALEILKKRYASGEINAEEFVQKKKDLES